MRSVRIKICGITTPAQAQAAAEFGVHAIGVVFYGPSSRAVSIDQARVIAQAAGPFVNVVGLFVDAGADFIEQVLEQVPLNLLQFHGSETPSDCERYNRPYIKALRMKPDLDVAAQAVHFASARGLLLDAYQPGVPGGTGASFDWNRFPQTCALPLILAGGLTPDNVTTAIASTHCSAVDVSGGVESSPGIKDPAKMQAFVLNASYGASKSE
ncbi:MAG TPA: phosphoribosylanthranilate isomerase [Cellvibrionaceae bacterium]